MILFLLPLRHRPTTKITMAMVRRMVSIRMQPMIRPDSMNSSTQRTIKEYLVPTYIVSLGMHTQVSTACTVIKLFQTLKKKAACFDSSKIVHGEKLYRNKISTISNQFWDYHPQLPYNYYVVHLCDLLMIAPTSRRSVLSVLPSSPGVSEEQSNSSKLSSEVYTTANTNIGTVQQARANN